MKRFVKIMLVMLLCVAPLAAQGSTLREYAQKRKSIATNDGLTVQSPEQYLGIDPCDEITGDDDYYTYIYSDRALMWGGKVSKLSLDWRQITDYVNMLVKTGYYEILEHERPGSDEEYWALGYIGPGEVKRAFGLDSTRTKKAAIILRSILADIEVYYSRDILTDDIDKTQQRLGKRVVDTPTDAASSASTASSGGNSSCTYCGGDGKCDKCGGDMWYWGYEWVYVNGSPVSQRVNKMCQAVYCTGGRCSKCGGDGVR